MASLTEELMQTMYDVDPATATNSNAVGWVDMADADAILVSAMASALTGVGVTAMSIVGGNTSTGGTTFSVKSHAVGSAPDAVGDTLVLEADKTEIIKAAGTNAVRYVSAYVTMANAADENVVVYTRRAKTQKAGNTADVVA